MMMVLKRREILIGFLIVLVAVAGVLNWSYEKKQRESELAAVVYDDNDSIEDSTTPERLDSGKLGEASYVDASGSQDEFFSQAKTTREMARSRAMEILSGIINNPNSDSESKAKAQDEIMQIADIIDKETIAENLIRAKGFEDAVVFINNQTANITVKAENLTATDMAKIQEIVTTQTGVSIKDIKIVEVK